MTLKKTLLRPPKMRIIYALFYLIAIEKRIMRADIHPEYTEVNVTCSCGSSFETRSTIGKDTLNIEVCASCHPFYTGKQKIMDTAGQVDKFRKRFKR